MASRPRCPAGALDAGADRRVRMLVVPVAPGAACVRVWVACLEPFDAEVVRAPPALADMQAAVGGPIEGVEPAPALAMCGFDMYCAEDGRLRGLPPNPAARGLAHPYADPDVAGALILVRE